MTDLIDRQALLRELSYANWGKDWDEALAKAIIENMPQAQQWIPVSERLPEPYSGEYLVTINDGSIYTDVLWFDSPGDGSRYESVFYKSDDDGYANICTDVIAWMPLPEPYKEGKNE